MTGGRRDIATLAASFWLDASAGPDFPRGFPRDIERAVARTLPLTIVRLPELNASAVSRRLLRWGVGVRVPFDDRDFMGCLVAQKGCGIVFVHGGDDPAEQRLTIAHETAHFLLDYLAPRNDVLAALGDSAGDVLDGLRPPTPAERVAAVLRHVHLGPHVHLLARDEEANSVVAMAESQADELAIELLAPRHDLWPRLSTAVDAAELGAHYGLPAQVFERLLTRFRRPPPVSFLDQTLHAAREGR